MKSDACKAITLFGSGILGGRKLAWRYAGEKYDGDYSRRICGDWCLRLLVRCHGFME
jgi:hypothetical protein